MHLTLIGVVTTWFPDRNFGFIDTGGREVFVHRRQVVGFGDLELGVLVQYEVFTDRRGRSCATRVRRLAPRPCPKCGAEVVAGLACAACGLVLGAGLDLDFGKGTTP